MDELDPYGSVELPDLAHMLSYSAKVIAGASEDYLEGIEEDLREAAITIIPAAQYVEDCQQEAAERLHAGKPQIDFLPPPKPAPRYLAGEAS